MSLETFSKRFNELMEEESVTARELSLITGLERKSISLWQSGRYYPKYDALIKLIYHFDVSAGYLLGLTDQPMRGNKKASGVVYEKVFKARLLEFMQDNKYSKYKMAQELGIGRTVFNRWVNIGAIPEVSNLIKLSVLTDETIEYLLGIED